jgi:shikimate dehydrogenase
MASAVGSAFRDKGFQHGVVVARNDAAGLALADRLGYHWRSHIGGATASIIVNVTPVGMAGGAGEHDSAFPLETVDAADTVFDVVALPSETPLITAARAAGKQVITGAEVIALQAAEQFERYTGVRPTPEQIAEASAVSRA